MKPTFSTYRSNLALLWACCCVGTTCLLAAAESLVVCSPNGMHFATAAEHGRIDCCNASDGAAQGTFYICHPTAISFSEDCKRLAAAGGRNGSPAKIKVWRVSDHQQLSEIITGGDGYKVIALSLNGRLVGGACADGRVEVWRMSDGQLQWSRQMPGAVEAIRFTSDSRRLVVSAKNRDERQLDACNGRPFPTGHTDANEGPAK